MRRGRLALADAVAVVAFVLIGRARHGHALSLAGTWQTAWPFLAGWAGGWLVAARWARGALGSGLVVWAAVVVGGLALRALAHQGVDPLFALVATVFVGLLLAGGRGLVAWWG